MRIGIYPGSFDPLTKGHLDIIERSQRICDKLIIAIAKNSAKKPLFSLEERIEIINTCCKGLKSIEVVAFEGLLIDFCKAHEVDFIIRGLRSTIDFDYEYPIATVNNKLAIDIDTIFLMTKGEYAFISSNMVREIASYNGDLSALAPQFVIQKIQQKFSKE